MTDTPTRAELLALLDKAERDAPPAFPDDDQARAVIAAWLAPVGLAERWTELGLFGRLEPAELEELQPAAAARLALACSLYYRRPEPMNLGALTPAGMASAGELLAALSAPSPGEALSAWLVRWGPASWAH